MQRILLIEDSEAFQEVVASALEGMGVGLTCAATAAEGYSQLEKSRFDLILLDILLPGEDGFEFCRRIRAEAGTQDIPVFFLTGKGDVADKISAFALGADDYIVKPFDLNELRARVAAKLSKASRKAEASDFIERGDLKLDVAGQKVVLTDNGSQKSISLTPAEFRILFFLARHERETVSGRQLMEAVWGKDLHVVDQNLYTHMHSLRRKLGDRAGYIRSVRGGGYLFSTARE